MLGNDRCRLAFERRERWNRKRLLLTILSKWRHLDRMIDRRRRIVIVGAGFGGLAAARSLRHLPVEVLVIDQRDHYAFQPFLYQ
jgi:xanthine/CO dehydrogenase XdhC/CoxF family maturation factor